MHFKTHVINAFKAFFLREFHIAVCIVNYRILRILPNSREQSQNQHYYFVYYHWMSNNVTDFISLDICFIYLNWNREKNDMFLIGAVLKCSLHLRVCFFNRSICTELDYLNMQAFSICTLVRLCIIFTLKLKLCLKALWNVEKMNFVELI